jgi:hypothetical protein
VQADQKLVDQLSQPSPDLKQLQADERALMTQIVPLAPAGSAGGAAPAPPTILPSIAPPPTTAAGTGGAAAPAAPAATPATPGGTTLGANGQPNWAPSMYDGDGPTRLAREKLESAIRRYQDVVGRIDAARIELDINRTAFKYRYSVMSPPEVPLKPKKPIATMIGIGSFVGAFLIAIIAAAVADLLGGRVLETWQVKRRLKIEVLGELEPPM